jgi:hypothetical protein
MAWEQLESVWPVHGSALVHDGVVYAVAGRSVFLDGGLRMVRLDLKTGEKLSESLMDDKNPATGNNLQEVTKVLQGPVGLPDILSCNGENVFMRSQKFDLEGNRLEIGPHSADAAVQGQVQRGPGVHLFAPNGFLDDTWYHRTYWVFGRSMAGGHSGYFQAGKYAPSGNILVSGGGYVYGYGRKPEHFRWTTVLERALFAAGTDPAGVATPEEAKPSQDQQAGPRRRANQAANQPATQQRAPTVSLIDLGNPAELDPAKKPITVAAWVKADSADGVIVSHGGPQTGYALTLIDGRAAFEVRIDSKLTTAVGVDRLIGEWHHVAGVLAADGKLAVYVDGEVTATADAKSTLPIAPKQGLQIGADDAGAVGEKTAPNALIGALDEIRIYHAAITPEVLKQHIETGAEPAGLKPVLSLSMEGAPRDESAAKLVVESVAVARTPGKRGDALQFAGQGGRNADGYSGNPQTPSGNRGGGTDVEHKWAQDIPIYVRGMVLADQSLCLVGPPDFTNEHEAFAQISTRDSQVLDQLAKQDNALRGASGSKLMIVNADTSEVQFSLDLDLLPVFDGLAAAQGTLYLSTADGRVVTFKGE